MKTPIHLVSRKKRRKSSDLPAAAMPSDHHHHSESEVVVVGGWRRTAMDPCRRSLSWSPCYHDKEPTSLFLHPPGAAPGGEWMGGGRAIGNFNRQCIGPASLSLARPAADRAWILEMGGAATTPCRSKVRFHGGGEQRLGKMGRSEEEVTMVIVVVMKMATSSVSTTMPSHAECERDEVDG